MAKFFLTRTRASPALIGIILAVLTLLPTKGTASADDVEIVNCLKDVDSCFRNFVAKYRSGPASYPDEEEAAYRRTVFEAGLREALAISHSNLYHLGLNNLSDRTQEEKFRLAGAVRLSDSEALPPSPNADDPVVIRKLLGGPSSVDWREEGVLPPIKSQGCGDCWAHGTTASVEAIAAIKCNRLTALSEQELADCSDAKADSQNCGKGGYPAEAMKWISKFGLASLTSYPYTGGSIKTCDITKRDNPAVQIDGVDIFLKVPEAKMASLIAEQPVVVGYFRIEPSFFELSATNPGVYDGSSAYGLDCDYKDPSTGGNLWHTMAAVGYGTDENGVDFWLLRNSWGVLFGNKGYVRIARGGSYENGDTGICNVRGDIYRPIKNGCPNAETGCSGKTADKCDFHFVGSNPASSPPTFSLGSGTKDRAISAAIVDSKTNKVIKVANTNAGFVYGKLPTGILLPGANRHQFYGNGNKVWVQVFNSPASVGKYADKCVILPITSAQLPGGINLNPNDKNPKYPENRRCVIFKTQ